MKIPKRKGTLVAALLVMSIVAAACGSSGTKKSGDVAVATTSAEEGKKAQEDRDKLQASGQDTRAAAEKPVPGGKLIYGLEADSANPWAHFATSCAISCFQVFQTITDPLFVVDKDQKLTPYLIKSYQVSADSKTHTWTVRDGIQFHDGTPLDGAAVKYNVDVCKASGLYGPIYGNVEKVEASGQTVTITAKTAWAPMEYSFASFSCSYMFSPKWMKTLELNPLRKDGPNKDADTAATPVTGKLNEPVGLGAFKFVSYTAGNGNSFKAAKNTNYWRKAEGLPYLDEVELVVAVDIQSRSAGLRSGQFNIIHNSNSDEIAKFEKDKDKFNQIQANAFAETNYILLNNGAGTNPVWAAANAKDGTMDPKGTNAASPLLNLPCRRALAGAIDLERYNKERGAGIVKSANGIFPPGANGYLADTGYPKFDLVAARAEMDKCLAAIGKPVVEFTFNTTNDTFNVESNQLIVAMWKEAFGDKVKAPVTPIEQGQYIGLALAGNYNAQGWRALNSIDLDQVYVRLHSVGSAPIGPNALNWQRIQNSEIDKALETQRATSDPTIRKTAAETVNKELGKNAYNWWVSWALWGIVSNPRVRNITDLTIPDTKTTIMPVIAGRHSLTQIWCQEGKCG